MEAFGKFILGIFSAVVKLIWPLAASAFDTIVTFIFVILHGSMAFIIQNVFNLYMINVDSMFKKEDDLVCAIISTYLPLFRTIAISVIVLISAWNLFKALFEYAGFSTDVEEPWKIGIKLMIFAALVWESKEICEFIVKIFEAFYSAINIESFDFSWLTKWGNAGTSGSLKEGNIKLDGEGWDWATEYLGIVAWIPKLIVFTIILIIDVKILGTGLDMVEKYLRVGFLFIISPLAFACGVAKSTSQVLSSWVKVVSGTLISVLIKYLLVKIMLEQGISPIKLSPGDTFDIANLIKSVTIIVALTSLMDQSDSLTRELGFQIGASSGKSSDTLDRITGRLLK